MTKKPRIWEVGICLNCENTVCQCDDIPTIENRKVIPLEDHKEAIKQIISEFEKEIIDCGGTFWMILRTADWQKIKQKWLKEAE